MKIIFIAFLIGLMIAWLYKLIFLNDTRPYVCGHCGWEGKKEQLLTAAEADGPWVDFCPECDSTKIIFNPNSKNG